MATGYTAKVSDGTVTEFREFAMECARAFGALVELRDDMTAPIPDTFKPSSYHSEALAKARKELKELDTVTDEDAERRAAEEFDMAMTAWQASKQHREEIRLRYESMLDQVKAWIPPTTDHQGLKNFMLQQLRDSIKFDCNHDEESWIPKRKTAKQWRAGRLKTTLRDIEYHKEHDDEERKSAADRTAWVRSLRDSLHQHEPATR